jgi:hypothetical protein
MRCEDFHDLAPEIALGIADGRERAAALSHLEGCPDCRRKVERLSGVADELLMLAPEREPPAGFESGVLERIGTRPQPRGRWRLPRRVLQPALAAALAAAIAIAVMSWAYSDEREVASGYLDTLEAANGEYFGARPLLDPSGAEAGVAFRYQGTPSWLLVTVDPDHREGISRAELVTFDGRRIPLREFRLDPAQGSWGGAIPIDALDVATVRLVGNRPGEVLETAPGDG